MLLSLLSLQLRIIIDAPVAIVGTVVAAAVNIHTGWAKSNAAPLFLS